MNLQAVPKIGEPILEDIENKKCYLFKLCDMLKLTYPDNILYQDIDNFKHNVWMQCLTSDITYKKVCNGISEALQEGLKLVCG